MHQYNKPNRIKRLIFLSILLIITSYACKKDDTSAPVPPKDSVLDYMPLKIGNYWIYETFGCDSGEANCTSKSIDTSRIIKDTIINDKIYFKLVGNYHLFVDPLYIRDSGDYLVDHNGRVLFTHTDSLQIFNEHAITGLEDDTVFYYYDKLTSQNRQLSVEAGIFDCLDIRTSLFRALDDFQIEHQGHKYYAKNVGLVKQSAFWAVSLAVNKRELIGYHLETDK